MNNNKNRILYILNCLDISCYSTLNVNFNNIYDDNSFCELKIYNFEDWKFAILLDKDDHYYFFGEHLLLIDKFKPSAVSFSVRLNLYKESDFAILCDMLQDLYDNKEYYFVSSFVYNIDYSYYNSDIDLDIPLSNKDYYKCMYDNILNFYKERDKLLKEEEDLLINNVLDCLNKFDIKGIGVYDRNKNKPDCISYSHRFIVNIMCDNKETLNEIKLYLNNNLILKSDIKYILKYKDDLNNENCHFFSLKNL